MMNATMSKLINASYHLRRMILLVALAATNVGISAELSSAAEEGSLLRWGKLYLPAAAARLQGSR